MNQETHNLVEVIEFCRAHRLPGEIVGRWVWVRFDTRPEAGARELLKGFGFRWVSKRAAWAHACGHPSRAGVGDPRNKYGCVPILAEDSKVA